MNNIIKKSPAFFLLIGAVVLMQAHAIEFWSQYAGTMGVLWSVLLEGAALWLWSQRSVFKNALALIASVLVLAGPLYQVSMPAVEQYQAAITKPALFAKQEQALIAERDRLSASIETYNSNSTVRVGWAGRIDSVNAELTRINDDLKSVYSKQAEVSMPWQSIAVIAMQALGLLIFQILIVLCIRAVTARTDLASEQQKRTGNKTEKNNIEKNQAKTQRLTVAA